MQLCIPALTTRLKLIAPWQATISSDNYDLLNKCGLRHGVQTIEHQVGKRFVLDRYNRNMELPVYHRELKPVNFSGDVADKLQIRIDIEPSPTETPYWRGILLYHKYDICATFPEDTVFNVNAYNVKKNGMEPTITFIIQNCPIRELTTRTHGGTSSSQVKLIVPLKSANEMFVEVVPK